MPEFIDDGAGGTLASRSRPVETRRLRPDGVEWVLEGAPTAAHWIADAAGVEQSTAREWIRIGRKLRELPVIGAAFGAGELSYSKVRTLTRVATPTNEAELVGLAVSVAASDLGQAIAAWMHRTHTPRAIEAHQHEQRSDDAESDARTTQSRRAVRKQTRLTRPQVDELLERRAAGATIKELAERFGIHRTTVMAHFQRRRGDRPSPP